jgi:hypothetical protein
MLGKENPFAFTKLESSVWTGKNMPVNIGKLKMIYPIARFHLEDELWE